MLAYSPIFLRLAYTSALTRSKSLSGTSMIRRPLAFTEQNTAYSRNSTSLSFHGSYAAWRTLRPYGRYGEPWNAQYSTWSGVTSTTAPAVRWTSLTSCPFSKTRLSVKPSDGRTLIESSPLTGPPNDGR